ncbi:unnamed protein product [Litomosoides sigmodontis]|uniref:Uncharacterized protein n=1 Tax=Litomosoides sigmodontis TaxID=42156 RepID=A0A3P6TXR9_LITSI|nr:unnamed protein product [Litomosoides sigmodontis]
MYDSIIHITLLLLFIGVKYTVSLFCYTVHWDAYSSFTEKAHKCTDDEEFCASLYDRSAESWYLRAIPLDKKCYSTTELRSRINCSVKEFREGCFMDPRYNSYKRSTAKLPVCICKGAYCNTQEKIESVWLEQNIYRFHKSEDCRDKLKKENSTTKTTTSSSGTTSANDFRFNQIARVTETSVSTATTIAATAAATTASDELLENVTEVSESSGAHTSAPSSNNSSDNETNVPESQTAETDANAQSNASSARKVREVGIQSATVAEQVNWLLNKEENYMSESIQTTTIKMQEKW